MRLQQQLQNQRISTRPAVEVHAVDPAASTTALPPATVQAPTAEPENVFPRPAQPIAPAAALSTHAAADADTNAAQQMLQPPSLPSALGHTSQHKQAAVGVKPPEHKPIQHTSYHVSIITYNRALQEQISASVFSQLCRSLLVGCLTCG